MRKSRILSLILAVAMVLSSLSLAFANPTVVYDEKGGNSGELSAVKPFDGVAPEAQILGMKVFSSYKSGADTKDTLAAIDDAITLGADSINLSLGSPSGFSFYTNLYNEEGFDLSEYEHEYVLTKARRAGIIVAAAAGNESRMNMPNMGAWTTPNKHNLNKSFGLSGNPLAINPDTSYLASPSSKYSTTSVASINNDDVYRPVITLINGEEKTDILFNDYAFYMGRPEFYKTLNGKTYDYVFVGVGGKEQFKGLDLKGKIAVIERGGTNQEFPNGITFAEKIGNAATAGAIGAIIYNHEEGELHVAIASAAIPTAFITKEDGKKLVDAVQTGKIFVDSEFKLYHAGDKVMSDFSSWGVTPDLKLKPEITAPGGAIYSSVYYPNDPTTKYESMDGTSMATPHVAGAVAILREYADKDSKFAAMSPKLKGNAIEALLMSTAKTVLNSDNNPYSPRQQGAGLMDIAAAIKSNTYLLSSTSGKAKVELKDNIGKTFDIKFSATNMSKTPVTYALNGSVITDGYETLTKELDQKTISQNFITDTSRKLEGSVMTFEGKELGKDATVTVPANKTIDITVKVTLSDDEVAKMSQIFKNGFFVEGFVELTDVSNAQPALSIPYLGFYGDWAKIPVVDDSMLYNYDEYNFYYGYGYYYSDPHLFEQWPNALYTYARNTRTEVGAGSKVGNSEWAAFSPNYDLYGDTVQASVALLRNVKEMRVEIRDKDDKLVKDLGLAAIYATKQMENYTDQYEGMYYLNSIDMPIWDGTNPKGEVMPDGQYNYVIKSYIDYDSPSAKEGQETVYPVKIDTKIPQATGSYNADNKILTVNAKDNNHVLMAYVADRYGTNMKKNSEIQRLEALSPEHTFTFDLSKYDGESAYVEIYDAALNYTYFYVDLSKSGDFKSDTTTSVTITHSYTQRYSWMPYEIGTRTVTVNGLLPGSKFNINLETEFDGVSGYELYTGLIQEQEFILKDKYNDYSIEYLKYIDEMKSDFDDLYGVEITHKYMDGETENGQVVDMIYGVPESTTYTAIAAPVFSYYGEDPYYVDPEANMSIFVTGYYFRPENKLTIKYNREKFESKNASSTSVINMAGVNDTPMLAMEKFDEVCNVKNIGNIDAKILKPNDTISVIVELDDAPLLDRFEATAMGAKAYLSTNSAQSLKKNMVSTQAYVQNRILSTINANAKFEYSYVNVLNGFSAEIKAKDVNKILALPGVKKVYYNTVYDAPKVSTSELPQMITSNQMIGLAGARELGYKGEGRVIAVIDTGFDVNHEIMRISDNTKEAMTLDTVQEYMLSLNATKRTWNKVLEASDVYKNRKFPFCYDYADRDTDATADINPLTGENNPHGVHVAGTIAANGLSYNVSNNPDPGQGGGTTPVNPNPGQGGGGTTPVNPGPGQGGGNTPAPSDPETPIDDDKLPAGPVVAIETFKDIEEGSWYYNDVKAVLEKGLMNGISESSFAPNSNTTRGMIATVIHRMAGLPTFDLEQAVKFSDVINSEWYGNGVNWSSIEKIVKGYEDGSFKPNKNITREELATMLYRYAVSLGKGYGEGWAYELKFVDADKVSDWALEAICWMNQNGIINGKDGNRLDPQGMATRAELSAMLNRLQILLK